MNAEQPIASLAIPVPHGFIIRASIMVVFLLSFLVLGIFNLIHGTAIIASSLWIFIEGFFVVGYCKERGIRRVLTDSFGAFCRRHYAWSFRAGDGRMEIRFGYELFGSRRYYLCVPIERVQSVHWSTGQGSYYSKRDIGDWSVVLWYQHGDPERTRRKSKWSRKPDQDVYIIGPERPKDITATFGHSFLDFLRTAGVTLVPGEDDCTFVRSVVEKDINAMNQI